MPRGREPRHVDPDLGDDGGRGDRTDAGDLIQPGRRLGERGQLHVDLGIDSGDVGVEPLDPRQHARQQEPVMIVEVPVEGLFKSIDLAAHPRSRQLGEHLGSRSPATSAASIARPDTPKMSEATTDSLMQASSSSFSTRFFSAVRAATRSVR